METVNEKQSNAKLSNGQTKEQLLARLPVPGPGRKKETKEQQIVKKAVKLWLKEYEEGLAEQLPKIRPALIRQAKKGNIQAFHEIHAVLGAYKKESNIAVGVQVNFNEDREKYGA